MRHVFLQNMSFKIVIRKNIPAHSSHSRAANAKKKINFMVAIIDGNLD